MSDVPPKQPVTGTASVRMDTGAGLPPFPGSNADPDPVPVTPASSGAGAGMNASTALVLMHNAASQAGGDAFPVLKAFQDYLESERQRARNRMMTLSIVFAVIIVVVVGAFALFWFSSMRGVQDTNRQLLEAALKRANAEPPAPVIVQQPPQSSAAETAKVIAEAVSKAQAEQTATFAKTLEGLNASIETMRKDNADLQAEMQRAKATAEKAEAERLAAEKAATERAAKEMAAKKAAEKKAAAERAAREATAQATAKPTDIPAPTPPAATATTAAQPATETTEQAAAKPLPPPPPQPAELQIPKYDSPPPPEGFSPDVMAVRLQKEPRPISWRVYVPMYAK